MLHDHYGNEKELINHMYLQLHGYEKVFPVSTHGVFVTHTLFPSLFLLQINHSILIATSVTDTSVGPSSFGRCLATA